MTESAPSRPRIAPTGSFERVRLGVLGGLPLRHVLAQVAARPDDPQLAHPLEGVVPGDLALADRVGPVVLVPARDRVALALHVRDDLEDRDGHARPGASPAARRWRCLVAPVAPPHLVERQRHVAPVAHRDRAPSGCRRRRSASRSFSVPGSGCRGAPSAGDRRRPRSRRRNTGPGRPSPIGAPSTRVTGISPAAVDVRNASSATNRSYGATGSRVRRDAERRRQLQHRLAGDPLEDRPRRRDQRVRRARRTGCSPAPRTPGPGRRAAAPRRRPR